MGIGCCGTGTQEKVLKLNEILNESLSETIDVKDEAQDEVTRLRAELADLRAQGLAFLKKTLGAKAENAAEIARLRAQVEEQESLLKTFKEFDNRNIEEDLVDCIVDGERMSVGEYWRLRGEKDPRQRWEGFEL
jgi:predicted transcriptional regulator